MAGDGAHANIVLVAEPGLVAPSAVKAVVAALQAQVDEDVSQFWNVAATISSVVGYASPDASWWPIYLKRSLDSGYLGYHINAQNKPASKVRVGRSWSIAASHECLEMLIDPSGMAVRRGPEIDENGNVIRGATADYLLEVCDPVQGGSYTKTPGGPAVCDFCTPAYYEDEQAVVDRHYSFLRSVAAPRAIGPGGYLTWKRSDNSWHQLDRFSGDSLRLTDLAAPPDQLALRTFVDKFTHRKHRYRMPQLHLKGALLKKTDRKRADNSSDRRSNRGKK